MCLPRGVCPPPEVWGQRAKAHLPHGVSIVSRFARTEASFGSAIGGDPCRRRKHLGSSPRAAQGATRPGSPGSPRQAAQDSSPAGRADPPRMTHPSTSKLSVATPATPETFLLSSWWPPPAPPTRPWPAPPGETPRALGPPVEPVSMWPPAGRTPAMCSSCVCVHVCACVCVCVHVCACVCVCVCRGRCPPTPTPGPDSPGGGPRDISQPASPAASGQSPPPPPSPHAPPQRVARPQRGAPPTAPRGPVFRVLLCLRRFLSTKA